MRKIVLLFGFFTLFILASTSRANALQVTLGSHDELVKICDLPDTEDYISSDGKHFDFGYKYTLFEVLYLPIYQEGEGEIVGYIDHENFVILSKSDIENIAKTNNIKNLASLVKIPFWDSWGGKFVAILLISLLVGSFVRNRYKYIVDINR